MNLLKCLTCGKLLTSEESTSHTFCDVETNKSTDILASKILTMKNNVGENCTLIYGLDGICYRITEKLPNLLPTELTPHKINRQATVRRNNLEDNRT